jgi:hypothetical protein
MSGHVPPVAGDDRAVGSADRDMAPGAPRAVDQGCLCSVLANAAYRAHADTEPFLDPRCPVHPADVPPSS